MNDSRQRRERPREVVAIHRHPGPQRAVEREEGRGVLKPVKPGRQGERERGSAGLQLGLRLLQQVDDVVERRRRWSANGAGGAVTEVSVTIGIESWVWVLRMIR